MRMRISQILVGLIFQLHDNMQENDLSLITAFLVYFSSTIKC